MSSVYQSLVQDHERALGAWHAEWLVIPEICQLCAGTLERSHDVLANMQVNTEAMQRNLECTQGLIMAEAVMMALAPKMGRLNAHHLVEQACKQAVAEQAHLKNILSKMEDLNAHFDAETLNDIFQPASYLGNIQAQIDAVLAQAQGK